MGLFDRFINQRVQSALMQLLSGVKTMGELRVPVSDAVYPDINAESYIRDGFSGNAAVYSITSLPAKKFGVIPRYLYKINDKEAAKKYKTLYAEGFHNVGALQRGLILRKKAYEESVVDENNPLAQLLMRPNPNEGQDQFFEKTYIYYQNGEAFIWLNRGDTKDMEDSAIDKLHVLEMYALPPSKVELIPDPDDVFGVLGYYFNPTGERHFIRKQDMIHWRKPNPNFNAITREHLRGLSPLRAGRKILTQDDEITDASVAMAQNGGAKGVLANPTLDKMTPTQESQVRSVVDRKINNNAMKAAVAMLQGTWQYHDLGSTSVDMQLVEWQKMTMERLCNLFGVPPELFTQGNTYANKNEARKDLVTNNIIPACNSFRDELNRQLLPAFGMQGMYAIDNDYSELPELQQDLKLMVESLKEADWLTYNEKRAAMNYEPSPNPNMEKFYISNSKVSIDDVGMEGFGEDDTDDNQNDEL